MILLRVSSVRVNHCKIGLSGSMGQIDRKLCRSFREGQNIAAALSPFKEVCPVLHHLGAWPQVKRMVVSRAHRVAWRVGEL